jgi:hypothetical protein
LNEPRSVLVSVAAIADQDVWAVGYHLPPSKPYDEPLAEHWDGVQWSIVPIPGVRFGDLLGVAAVASNDVWAVGDTGANPLTMHWDGTAWSFVPSPNPSTQGSGLWSVAAVATNDIWAAGYAFNGPNQRSLIEHWDGAAWKVVTNPSPGLAEDVLSGIAVAGPSDVWAVGASDGRSPYVEHWDGATWGLVKAPAQGSNATLFGVMAIASGDVWAVGDYGGTRAVQTLTEHWDGTRWHVSFSPNFGRANSFLRGVAAVSSADVWAVGNGIDSHFVDHTLIEQWDGTAWSLVSSPNVGTDRNDLYAVAALPDGETWAVGAYVDDATGHNDTLVEQICE